MAVRRIIGALIVATVLTAPGLVFGQGGPRQEGGPRSDPNALKTYAAPPATAPRSSVPSQPPILIVPRDRAVIQTYYRNEGRSGHCPPGQAKKPGGCGPGNERAAGAPSPAARSAGNMSIEPLPRPLLERLTVAPKGYAYGYSNGSVVLYATGSRAVADSAPAY